MTRPLRRCLRAFILPLGLLAVLATVAHGAPEDRKTLILRGRIVGPENRPLAGAQVTVKGSHRAHANANRDGEYELTLRLGKVADLARKPMALRMRAERRGWRLAVSSGESEVGLDLRVVAGSEGVAICEVRASPDSFGSAIVEMLSAEGEVTVVTTVNFTGTPVEGRAGARNGALPAAELPLVGRVGLVGVSARSVAPPARAGTSKPHEQKRRGDDHANPSSVKPDAKGPTRETKATPPPSAEAAARPPVSSGGRVPAATLAPAADTARVRALPSAPEPITPDSTALVRIGSPAGGRSGASPVRPPPDAEPRARAGPLVRPDPPITPMRGTAGPDSCDCLIEGTVEVNSDRPLPKSARVVVALVSRPAFADTVELFMGSPRPFRLPPAPCGPQRLRITNLGPVRFDVTSRKAMAGFQCVADAHRQFHLVLVPR